MHPVTLGPALYCEGGYKVCEVFGQAERPEGFTFDGPGFSALIIYPSFNEALLALQSLTHMLPARHEPPR